MNGFIERMNEMPFSVSDGIQISITQTIILYISILAFVMWLLKKKKAALTVASVR
jgi:hypothetical protein